MKKDYWLAEAKISSHGYVNEVKLTDGPHDKPSGVEKAAKIIKGLKFLPQERNFVMVTVEPVPDTNVKINNNAINTLNGAFETTRKFNSK